MMKASYRPAGVCPVLSLRSFDPDLQYRRKARFPPLLSGRQPPLPARRRSGEAPLRLLPVRFGSRGFSLGRPCGPAIQRCHPGAISPDRPFDTCVPLDKTGHRETVLLSAPDGSNSPLRHPRLRYTVLRPPLWAGQLSHCLKYKDGLPVQVFRSEAASVPCLFRGRIEKMRHPP